MKTRKTNKAKRVDPKCANHNWCPRCKGARLYQANKGIAKSIDQIKDME